jgi:hypothetical protein
LISGHFERRSPLKEICNAQTVIQHFYSQRQFI